MDDDASGFDLDAVLAAMGELISRANDDLDTTGVGTLALEGSQNRSLAEHWFWSLGVTL